MIAVEPGGNRGAFTDRLFTIGTNFLQSTVIRYRVRMLAEKYIQRPGLRVNQDFLRQMNELGLTPERLWWGPMTLFPQKAQFLLSEIEKHPPKRILEIGSGTSSALFAALAVKHNFTMLSLDNYKDTMKYVQSILEGIPCDNRVRLQQCGLIRRSYPNGKKYWWYDAILDDKQGLFDFVFIDGPMSSLVGRNGALPEIKPYLAKDHRIYIDDYNRAHEKACVTEWGRHFPGLIVETFEECKGVALLKLPNI